MAATLALTRMIGPPALDRFAYAPNLERSTGRDEWRSAFWPPAGDYRLFCLDLTHDLPALGHGFVAELQELRAAVDAEWARCRSLGADGSARLHGAVPIARCLRRIAALLPGEADRRALILRADALEHGYDDGALSILATLDEEITIVAGRLGTWHGKQLGAWPTAFGCARDPRAQAAVEAVAGRRDEVTAYLRGLHKALRLGAIPGFAPARLFFMAGEGNTHPKHIAYFLPSDEGVKRSPFKKTYYFTNTHRELIDAVGLPLAWRLLDVGGPIPAEAAELDPIPALGVYAHELGHVVHREGRDFAALNAADRWASMALQETAADVFGTLLLADVLAPALGLTRRAVVIYHLAECLRYVDRGLGCFPDSDGMHLQLAYLVSFGALAFEPGTQRLVGEPDVVIAAYRSMARVLADTLLDGDVERGLALHRDYGPANPAVLRPLLAGLRDGPPKTIEYVQDGRLAQRGGEPPVVDAPPSGDPLRDFYCRPLADRGTLRTRYEIWERGEAVADSVTPSTYCADYRTHMILKILSLARRGGRVFSIGCGNAFVEAGLRARGVEVQAIDCNAEAVALATQKGVDAVIADYGALPRGHLAGYGAIYADGLLGHLYRPEVGLDRFFETLHELAPPPGSWLVLSNDAPKQAGDAVAPHGGLADFWLFSPGYVCEAVARFGHEIRECYSFPYERPLSGLRNRTICIAQVAGAGAAVG